MDATNRSISVLIPTHGRPDKLANCLAGLATQASDDVQVLVGIDGDDHGATDITASTLPSARAFRFEHRGPAAVRNRLLEHAEGELILFLNDDVIPAADLLATHDAAHREIDERHGPAMVLGSAPWLVPTPDRLFDRLVRSTSMVFFYDAMTSDPWHDHGFRHAWTLNLSVRRDALSAGFDEHAGKPCYEDLHWAWRSRLPVFYRPNAIVQHDHIYQPEGYLRRERIMGSEAYRFAQREPEFARDLFRRDITSDAEIDYSRHVVERERPMIDRLTKTFMDLAQIDSAAIDGTASEHLLRTIYEHHLPLKRWWWRVGLLEAIGELDSALLPQLAA